MIFRVLSNNIFCRNEKGEKVFIKKKNKDLNVLYFDWRNGIKIYSESLLFKRLNGTKKENLFLNSNIFLIKNKEGNDLILQGFDEEPKVLKIDEEDIISPSQIQNIQEEDSIIVFQEQQNKNDYIFSELTINETLLMNDFKSIFQNYVFKTEPGKGIILNDFFIY